MQIVDVSQLKEENKDSSKKITDAVNSEVSLMKVGRAFQSQDDSRYYMLSNLQMKHQIMSPTRRGDGNLLQTNLNSYMVSQPRDTFSSRTLITTTENQVNDQLSRVRSRIIPTKSMSVNNYGRTN